MIDIKRAEDCSGCAACVQNCASQCITFQADTEGFYYPEVDAERCIGCGLCENACPVIQHKEYHPVVASFAAASMDDELRFGSSSGAVFGTLCTNIFEKKGLVCGVRMRDDCRDVVFDFAEDMQQLEPILGSKYMQSYPIGVFNQIEKILQGGRLVLFSGTPCQVNGLKLFLGREYENLLSVDIICHGVPSPVLWRKYVDYFETSNMGSLLHVNFRAKPNGWNDYGLEMKTETGSAVFTPHANDPFFRLFLKNVCLRPSCYECKSKIFRLSDLTIGDFWGIDQVLPGFNDDKGTSAVIIRSEKGMRYFETVKDRMNTMRVRYDEITAKNPSEYSSVSRPKERKTFFNDLYRYDFDALLKKNLVPARKGSLMTKGKRMIKRILYSGRG